MVLAIVQHGDTNDDVLHRPARLLSRDEILSPEIQKLMSAMHKTMRHLPGVGIAAPQVGESVQLLMIEDLAKNHHSIPAAILAERGRHPIPFHILINPILTVFDVAEEYYFEGCLSVQGLFRILPRHNKVKVIALNEKAEPVTIEASGWYARILQHEVDHLQGRLYIDMAPDTTQVSVHEYRNYWAMATKAEIRAYFCQKTGIQLPS